LGPDLILIRLYIEKQTPSTYKCIAKTGIDNIYRIKTLFKDSSFQYTSELKLNQVPNKFILYQNYPNPFNTATTIKYSLPSNVRRKTKDGFIPSGVGGENVTLKVYDILGKKVATLINKKQKPGEYQIIFDISSLPAGSYGLSSGIYYYRLITKNFIQTKKMILQK